MIFQIKVFELLDRSSTPHEKGDNFYTNTNCCILDCGKVTIGNNVWIGPNVGIYTPNHALCSDERTAGYERSPGVEIGDNV